MALDKTIIEIDCAPCTPRPDEYFRYICKNILHIEYKEPISKLFGNWTWDEIEYESKDQRDEVANYLKNLYDNGLIRYASW